MVAMKRLFLCFAMIVTLWLGVLSTGFSGSATWRLNPNTDDWNTAANWTSAATVTWTLTQSMHIERDFHTATLLPSGQVLVVGGLSQSGLPRTAEIYNPTTDQWLTTQDLGYAVVAHTATLLQDGRVLVAGGNNLFGPGYATAS